MRILPPLLIIMLFLSSCNQTGIGVQSAVVNTLTAPFRAISSSIADNHYEELKTRTQRKPKEIETTLECGPSGRDPDNTKDISDIAKVLMAGKCECLAWGSCTKQVCACEKLCPSDFSIFKHPVGQTLEQLSEDENKLAFWNASGGSKHKATNGYCWGHANVTAQFNRMAFFDNNKKAPFNLDSSDEKEQEKAIDFYKELIDQITSNKAISIPGFANLQEFSQHPALQSYIADKMALNWADNAMSWQGLSVATTSKSQGSEHYKKVFAEVKERLDMGVQPVLVFSARKDSFRAHATLVSHYEETPEGIKLCMRESAYTAFPASSCMDSISIEKDGFASYGAWGKEIGAMELAHNNNADMVAQAHELMKRCRLEKSCVEESK